MSVTRATAERLMDQHVIALTEGGASYAGELIAHGVIVDGGEHAAVLVTGGGDVRILTLRSIHSLKRERDA